MKKRCDENGLLASAVSEGKPATPRKRKSTAVDCNPAKKVKKGDNKLEKPDEEEMSSADDKKLVADNSDKTVVKNEAIEDDKVVA